MKFYNNSITSENLKVLDYLNEMDKNDPPIFIYNPVYEDEVITKIISLTSMSCSIVINTRML